MSGRPLFAPAGPGRVRVRATSTEAINEAVAAFQRVWPEPDQAAPALRVALEAGEVDDERTALETADAERVAYALADMGCLGTALELRNAIAAASRSDTLDLFGFVARNGEGELCYFTEALADGVELPEGLRERAAEAERWQVPRGQLPRGEL